MIYLFQICSYCSTFHASGRESFITFISMHLEQNMLFYFTPMQLVRTVLYDLLVAIILSI